MRTKMIAGNWKMYNAQRATEAFITGLEEWLSADAMGMRAVEAIADGKIEVVIAPPFTSILAAAATRKGEAIKIAGQNVHYEPKGAFTGEISLPMLAEAGCQYVIIGHSERRHVFGESDELLEKKLLATLEDESRILPIFCVGELLKDRETGNTEQVLKHQLDTAWSSLTSDVVGDMVVIAYEPVWAIGTGQTASNEDAEKACDYIRSLAFERFGMAASDALRILYGGSVKPENSKGILSQTNVDGLLIGGASLDLNSFVRIIATAI